MEIMIEEDVSVGQTIELCVTWGEGPDEDAAGDHRMTMKEEKATHETVLKLW